MTERSYINTIWGLSPRLIEVETVTGGGADSLSVQDLHDTLKSNTLPAGEADDSLDSLDDEPLITSAGKEPLGDGKLVGITATLLDAQIAFKSDYTPAETGTATSADANGTSLTDTAAGFLTNGVERGAVIINFDDRSVAEVLKVNSDTHLEHRVLQNGSNNDWLSGDNYQIFNIVQKELNGGNAVGKDAVGDPLSPIFPSAFTQVIRTSSSSATLQELTEIQDQSYTDGRIFIDTVGGEAGTVHPIGTTTRPVSNHSDAFVINTSRSLPGRYLLKGASTLSSDDISGTDWLGTALPSDALDLGGSTTVSTAFEFLKLAGACSGSFTARDCVLDNISGFNGFLFGGAIAGTLTLAAGEAHIVNAHAAASAGNFVTIDVNGASTAIFMPGWEGDVHIVNHSHSGASTVVNNRAGTITLDATCTSGSVLVNGIGRLVDNSGVGCTVTNDLVDPDMVDLIEASTVGNATVAPDGLSVTIYARDGTTVLRVLDVTADQKIRTIQ